MSLKKVSPLLLALCVGAALFGCSKPTDNKPEATVGDAVEIPEIASPAENTPAGTVETPDFADSGTGYEFTDNTYIGFAGSKSAAGITMGTHYGQFLAYEGGVVVPESGLEDLHIQIEIDMTKVNTDNSVLTGTLKGEQFFKVDEFPAATFVSTSTKKTGDAYEVTGNLTLIGVTKSITFPASVEIDGDLLTAQAEFSVDRTAWGVGVGYVMNDQIVDKAVLMEFDIEAKAMAKDRFSQAQEGSRPK